MYTPNLNNKDIKYIDRDYTNLLNNLITFSRTYFPNTFRDFSPASPGRIFMEMSSYVGDVLSFYLDTQVQECFLQFSRQSNNVYNHAYQHGYKPKQTGLASGPLNFFQLVPAKSSGGAYFPDYNYALIIPSNTRVASTVQAATGTDTQFLTTSDVDFTFSSSIDPTEVTVYEVDGAGNPIYYLLKKSVKIISGQIRSVTRTINEFTEFPTVEISGTNIAQIQSIVDSDNNQYYEVDYLSQDTVYIKSPNRSYNDPNKTQQSTDSPYILDTIRTDRRFVTRFTQPGLLQIQFGAGRNPDLSDEEILPNQNNVGLGLPFEQDKLTTAYSPNNFINTNTYGIAPSNTTLTIRYISGGGLSANTQEGVVTRIPGSDRIRYVNSQGRISSTAQFVSNSVSCTNPAPITGGRGGDTLLELRQNTMGIISSQLRTVTLDDYAIRVFSMPSIYGSVSKVYVEKPQLSDQQTSTIETVSIYALGYDQNRNLNYLSNTVKENIRTYLNEYKMIGDTVEIRDAFIINIGVNFDIVVRPNYNNNVVIVNCINQLIEYFNIVRRDINQPIQIRELFVLLDKVEGVQTVDDVRIVNKVGIQNGYSQYAYDIEGATLNKIVYPALDPSIFELRYPNQDINGKVINF